MGNEYRREISRLMGFDLIKLGLIAQWIGAGLMFVAKKSHLGIVLLGTAEILILLGTVFLITGCGKFAEFHDRSRWWGLLGLFNIVGVIPLMLLPLMRRHATGAGFEVLHAERYRRDIWRMDVRVVLDESLGAGIVEPVMLRLPRGASVEVAGKILCGVLPVLEAKIATAGFRINGLAARRIDELSDRDELLIGACNSVSASA